MNASRAGDPLLDRALLALDQGGLLSARSRERTRDDVSGDATAMVAGGAASRAQELLLSLGFLELPNGRGVDRRFATYEQAADRWLTIRLLPDPQRRGDRAVGERLRRRLDRRSGPGMFVAIMGPDGAGKSTLRDGIAGSIILPVARHYAGLYPSDRRRYPVVGLGMAALLLRLWRIRLAASAQRRRGRLVLFDRYAYDALIPLSLGASLKSRLRRALLVRSFPAPDLLVVLDAPVEVLQDRRKEHPVEVVEAHRAFYARLARDVPNAVVVDASGDADSVRRAVTGLIWRRLVERRLVERRGRHGR